MAEPRPLIPGIADPNKDTREANQVITVTGPIVPTENETGKLFTFAPPTPVNPDRNLTEEEMARQAAA